MAGSHSCALQLFRYGELSTYVLTVLVVMLLIDALSRRPAGTSARPFGSAVSRWER